MYLKLDFQKIREILKIKKIRETNVSTLQSLRYATFSLATRNPPRLEVGTKMTATAAATKRVAATKVVKVVVTATAAAMTATVTEKIRKAIMGRIKKAAMIMEKIKKGKRTKRRKMIRKLVLQTVKKVSAR
jgi:hypothetical protein